MTCPLKEHRITFILCHSLWFTLSPSPCPPFPVRLTILSHAAYCSKRNSEVSASFKTLLTTHIYQTTWNQTPEDSNLIGAVMKTLNITRWDLSHKLCPVCILVEVFACCRTLALFWPTLDIGQYRCRQNVTLNSQINLELQYENYIGWP